jgi:hypothetical protein
VNFLFKLIDMFPMLKPATCNKKLEHVCLWMKGFVMSQQGNSGCVWVIRHHVLALSAWMIVLVMIELAIALSYMLITNMLFLSVLQYSVHDFWQLSVHNIRLPKQSTVGDVIVELKDKVCVCHLLVVSFEHILFIFPNSVFFLSILCLLW